LLSLSEADDAELDDEMYSTLIGTRLDEATALGRTCGCGPVGLTVTGLGRGGIALGLGPRKVDDKAGTGRRGGGGGGEGEGDGEGEGVE
jgi:hypothetical protein